MRRKISKVLVCFLFSIILINVFSINSAFSYHDENKLERAERKIERPRKDKHYRYTSTGYITEDNAGMAFFDALFGFLISGPFTGLGDGLTWPERHAMLKQEFNPALPTFRLEGAWHKLNTDVQGYNLNATAGYLSFGADVDFVHWFEETPKSTLKIISPHFLLRSSPTGFFQIDLAVGAKIIRGRRTHTGFEVGLPIYIHFNNYVSLDLKSYTAFVEGTRIFDESFGITGKWRMVGVRAAYRLVDIGGESLHGPQVGLVLQW